MRGAALVALLFILPQCALGESRVFIEGVLGWRIESTKTNQQGDMIVRAQREGSPLDWSRSFWQAQGWDALGGSSPVWTMRKANDPTWKRLAKKMGLSLQPVHLLSMITASPHIEGQNPDWNRKANRLAGWTWKLKKRRSLTVTLHPGLPENLDRPRVIGYLCDQTMIASDEQSRVTLRWKQCKVSGSLLP
jgi:hypothetical protein